jgi:NAD kinase
VADEVVKCLSNGSLTSQKVMKLNCNINCETVMEAVCQLEIHRNMKAPIVILNIYLENENKAKVKIGVLKGDGLLISTPMGSYCKSLNLNGPLMCKTMENILITPICPLSMKFRPICLPASSKIFIEIDPDCRTDHAELYFDEGGFSSRLNKGELLRIRISKYQVNLVAHMQEGC